MWRPSGVRQSLRSRALAGVRGRRVVALVGAVGVGLRRRRAAPRSRTSRCRRLRSARHGRARERHRLRARPARVAEHRLRDGVRADARRRVRVPVASNGSWQGTFTVPATAVAAATAPVAAVCVSGGLQSLMTIYTPQTFTVTRGEPADDDRRRTSTPPPTTQPGTTPKRRARRRSGRARRRARTRRRSAPPTVGPATTLGPGDLGGARRRGFGVGPRRQRDHGERRPTGTRRRATRRRAAKRARSRSSAATLQPADLGASLDRRADGSGGLGWLGWLLLLALVVAASARPALDVARRGGTRRRADGRRARDAAPARCAARLTRTVVVTAVRRPRRDHGGVRRRAQRRRPPRAADGSIAPRPRRCSACSTSWRRSTRCWRRPTVSSRRAGSTAPVRRGARARRAGEPDAGRHGARHRRAERAARRRARRRHAPPRATRGDALVPTASSTLVASRREGNAYELGFAALAAHGHGRGLPRGRRCRSRPAACRSRSSTGAQHRGRCSATSPTTAGLTRWSQPVSFAGQQPRICYVRAGAAPGGAVRDLAAGARAARRPAAHRARDRGRRRGRRARDDAVQHLGVENRALDQALEQQRDRRGRAAGVGRSGSARSCATRPTSSCCSTPTAGTCEVLNRADFLGHPLDARRGAGRARVARRSPTTAPRPTRTGRASRELEPTRCARRRCGCATPTGEVRYARLRFSPLGVRRRRAPAAPARSDQRRHRGVGRPRSQRGRAARGAAAARSASRRSASSRAASRTTSTTCSPRSSRRPSCSWTTCPRAARRSTRPRSSARRRAAPRSCASCSRSRSATAPSRSVVDLNAIVDGHGAAAAPHARRARAAADHHDRLLGRGRRRSDAPRAGDPQPRGQRARRDARRRRALDRDRDRLRRRRARERPRRPVGDRHRRRASRPRSATGCSSRSSRRRSRGRAPGSGSRPCSSIVDRDARTRSTCSRRSAKARRSRSRWRAASARSRRAATSRADDDDRGRGPADPARRGRHRGPVRARAPAAAPRVRGHEHDQRVGGAADPRAADASTSC